MKVRRGALGVVMPRHLGSSWVLFVAFSMAAGWDLRLRHVRVLSTTCACAGFIIMAPLLSMSMSMTAACTVRFLAFFLILILGLGFGAMIELVGICI